MILLRRPNAVAWWTFLIALIALLDGPGQVEAQVPAAPGGASVTPSQVKGQELTLDEAIKTARIPLSFMTTTPSRMLSILMKSCADLAWADFFDSGMLQLITYH